MNWLPGWTKRIKFSVDNNNINEALYDFPVLVYLDSTYSEIFNTLGENSKRIYFAIKDTNEPCYCEIANWNTTEVEAHLWVKLPSITASGLPNTEFYMYYGMDNPDNTVYIGDTGEVAGQKVWNDNFKGVYHFSQEPPTTSNNVLDSTSNNKHGTTYNMGTANWVDGSIHKGLELNGTNEYVQFPSDTFNSYSTEFTLEHTAKSPSNCIGISRGTGGEGLSSNIIRVYNGDEYVNVWYESGGGTNNAPASLLTPGVNFLDGEFHYVSHSFKDTTWQAVTEAGAFNMVIPSAMYSTAPIYLAYNGNSEWGEGVFEEVRISQIVLSENWCTVTRLSNQDNLLIKGSLEEGSATIPTFANKIQMAIPEGVVKTSVDNFPVLINITNNSGVNKTDISIIFDELPLHSDFDKIAVTNGDNTEQYYIEVENWNPSNRTAQLWVKLPIVSSTGSGLFWLNYDKEAEHNTEYVGFPSSAPAKNVWDANFVGVYHITQRPYDGEVVSDSTSYNNDGLFNGVCGISESTIGNFIQLDGGGWFNLNNTASYTGASFSWEVIFKVAPMNVTAAVYRIFSANTSSGDNTILYSLISKQDGNGYIQVYDMGTAVTSAHNTTTFFDDNTIRSAVLTLDDVNSRVYLYQNGEDISPTTIPALNVSDFLSRINSTDQISVGQEFDNLDASDFFVGLIREIRISNIKRSEAWLQATHKSNMDNLILYGVDKEVAWLHTYEGGELSMWPNRIKIDIDHTKVDSTLVNFPLLINLTDSSGVTNADVTSVMTHLNTSPLNKKIAVTTSDGVSQLPVEIERWDTDTLSTQLWTKVPNILSYADTSIYLYYDVTKSDNIDYVGDIGNVVSKTVWNNNYQLVYHMSQSPIVGEASIQDSSVYNYNGTPTGSFTNTPVSTPVGKAIVFNGTNDFIEVPDVTPPADNTIEVYLQPDNNTESHIALSQENMSGFGAGSFQSKFLGWRDSELKGEEYFSSSPMVIPDVGVQNHLAMTIRENSEGKLYFNGILNSTQEGVWGPEELLRIGYANTSGNRLYYKGNIREVRYSSVTRSANWLRVSYFSTLDSLVIYNDVEEYTEPIIPPEPTYYFHGYIQEKAVPVARKVFLYDRNTGDLIDSALSDSSTGYYLLETFDDEEHFIVVMDDVDGDSYNPIIKDKLLPNGK